MQDKLRKEEIAKVCQKAREEFNVPGIIGLPSEDEEQPIYADFKAFVT